MNQFLSNSGLLAWQYLKLNPAYQQDCSSLSHIRRPDPEDMNGILITHQIEQDVEFQKWGILAAQDPATNDTSTMPFWQMRPTLEAKAVENIGVPFMEILKKAHITLSGLRLLSGEIILQLCNENRWCQIKLPSHSFVSNTASLILQLPVQMNLNTYISRSQDFWHILSPEGDKKHLATIS